MPILNIQQLNDFTLDYAVAIAENFDGVAKGENKLKEFHLFNEPFRPSRNISQGYDIIIREGIGTAKFGDYWVAMNNTSWIGDTPLIAAMKYYVSNTLGNEIEIPDYIINLQTNKTIKP